MDPLPIGDYDPSRVTQIIGDIEPKAYGPDTRISVTPSGPSFTVQQGQDGHIVRVKNRAVHHVVSFTLMRSDPANEKLMELYQKDVDGVDGAGIVKYQLTDNNGTEKVSAPHAWIPQIPDVTYSAAGDVRVWTLNLGSANVQVGALKQL